MDCDKKSETSGNLSHCEPNPKSGVGSNTPDYWMTIRSRETTGFRIVPIRRLLPDSTTTGGPAFEYQIVDSRRLFPHSLHWFGCY